MDLGLTNATAVVVGGGRGMGLASARCLADDGARIAIIARSRDDLDAATADLTDRGSADAVGIVADIRDVDRVNAVFADLGERWNGELNVLVNAVGPSAVPGVPVVLRVQLAGRMCYGQIEARWRGVGP